MVVSKACCELYHHLNVRAINLYSVLCTLPLWYSNPQLTGLNSRRFVTPSQLTRDFIIHSEILYGGQFRSKSQGRPWISDSFTIRIPCENLVPRSRDRARTHERLEFSSGWRMTFLSMTFLFHFLVHFLVQCRLTILQW